MAKNADAGADEPVFSLDLQEIFDCKDLDLEQVNSEDIPDDVLSSFINDDMAENSEKIDESECPSTSPAETNSSTTKRFRPLSSDEVDAIGNKTHKQTVWGLKEFKGNF